MVIQHDLSVILRVISSTEKINVGMLKERCTQTYVFIVTEFKWVHISTSMHNTLAHLDELIEANEERGLGTVTEQGSEGMYIKVRLGIDY